MIRNTPQAASKKAFTLIELLVVIAIIALLIGILLPALGRARISAQDLKCLAQIREMGTQMALYANDDRRGYYPTKPEDDGPPRGFGPAMDGQQNQHGFAGFYNLQVIRGALFGGNQYVDGNTIPLMAPYVEDTDPALFVCPRDEIDSRPVIGGGTPTEFVEVVKSGMVTGVVRDEMLDADDPRTGLQWKNCSYFYRAGVPMDVPSQFMLLADETNESDIGTDRFYGVMIDQKTNEVTDAGRYGEAQPYRIDDNHEDMGGNMVFNDGSARFVNQNEVVKMYERVNEGLPHGAQYTQSVD
jgi:prepilin-type N-terminal cleavage/methylation domain-containing protein